MGSDVAKWTGISNMVMAAGCFSHLRDAHACKGKWHLLLLDY